MGPSQDSLKLSHYWGGEDDLIWESLWMGGCQGNPLPWLGGMGGRSAECGHKQRVH